MLKWALFFFIISIISRDLRVHRHRGSRRRPRKDPVLHLPRDLRDPSRGGPYGGKSNILSAA
jgi:hypothetical protein